MAKGNIAGFLEAGKVKGATGAFTTIWDDGGSYLFSADWYGVYVAAEKAGIWTVRRTIHSTGGMRLLRMVPAMASM